MFDANQIATTTYRRANGSQAAVSRPRVVRAPKTFPRAHTPSQAARKQANAARRPCHGLLVYCRGGCL